MSSLKYFLGFLLASCGASHETTSTPKGVLATKNLPNSSEFFEKSGHVTGNGGSLIVCFDKDQITSAEVFDTYEGRILRRLEPKFAAGSTALQKASIMLERIKPLDLIRYERLSGWLKLFEQEMRLVDGDLISTEDLGDLVIQPQCKIAQAVIQKWPELPQDPRYWINKSLWRALDKDNQAVLMLHEIIYRDALMHGHTDSRRARVYNALLVADQFALMETGTYNEWLRKAHWQVFTHNINDSYSIIIRYFGNFTCQEVLDLCRINPPEDIPSWELTSMFDSLRPSDFGDFLVGKSFWEAGTGGLCQLWKFENHGVTFIKETSRYSDFVTKGQALCTRKRF